MAAIRAAVAELFEPGEDPLRLETEEAAAVFLALLFTRSSAVPSAIRGDVAPVRGAQTNSGSAADRSARALIAASSGPAV
ncbi:MAG: hypothetical protein JWP48_3525 [Actinoallomurus sp.]|jgi:hypothetical protein|nr:hypothetical protein [Actinoallomurus sp.]